MALDDQTKQLVRDKQLAWFARWLDSDDAKATWARLTAAGVETALASRPSDLFDADALTRAVNVALASETLLATVTPAVIATLRDAATRARELEESPRGLLGEEAAKAVERVAAEPTVVSEAIVRAVLTSPAVEALVGAHLFEALDGFSRKVNPFVADWGLPALLDALPLLGRSAIKAAVFGVQQEFERRLEPETRRYLAGFVRQSLERAAREVTTKGGEPEHVRLRQEIAAALMRVPLREYIWSPDAPVGARALDAARAGVKHVLGHPSVREAVDLAIRDLLAESTTLAALCEKHGVAIPETEALAEATYPAIRRILSSPSVREELARRIDESLAD